MAFRFKKATCVVAGTFNMYIIQPRWLVKIGIIPKDTTVAIASRMDEPGFRYVPTGLGFRWLVNPNRIEIDTDRRTEDCGEKIAKILKALPETPLAALGNNSIYSAPISELDALAEEFRRSPAIPEGTEFAQRSFHFAVSKAGRLYNLQLSITPEEIEISTNVHTELRERESELAQEAARHFLKDREDAEALVQFFFKVSIDHADSDTNPTERAD